MAAHIPWARAVLNIQRRTAFYSRHTGQDGTLGAAYDLVGEPGNLVNGANIAGFLKVANAMLDQELV
jgi:hypothetical protein